MIDDDTALKIINSFLEEENIPIINGHFTVQPDENYDYKLFFKAYLSDIHVLKKII